MNAAERRAWRTHVYGCVGLTPGQRIVLLALSDFADWPEGTDARPSVKLLAEICGFKERVVKEALHNGRELELIFRTARANPKRGLAAVYKLLPVELSRCASVHVETDFKVHETQFQGARDGVSRCASVHPTNPYTPSQNTEGRASAPQPPADPLSDDDEPSRYCAKHPNGTDENCAPCGAARKRNAAWNAAEPERKSRRASAIRAEREACGLCDPETGMVEVDADSLARCDHRRSA